MATEDQQQEDRIEAVMQARNWITGHGTDDLGPADKMAESLQRLAMITSVVIVEACAYRKEDATPEQIIDGMLKSLERSSRESATRMVRLHDAVKSTISSIMKE